MSQGSPSREQPGRADLIRAAGWIALLGNAFLAIAKITVGILSGSLAVLSDGTDSSTDVLIAIMTLIAGKVAVKPGDREHPYGHGRIETVASAVISFIVFFAGGQIFLSAAGGLLRNEASSMPAPLALWVTLVSIAGKILLAWSQFHYGKRAGSAMLTANGKNMQGDIVTSIAVLVGLGLAYLTGFAPLDEIFALLVSVWIMKNAVGIFMEANTELMDGTSDHGKYAEIFHAVSHIQLAANPHRVRIRHLGSVLIVDLDIEIEPEMSLAKAHDIAMDVEASIKKHIPDVYDVIVHMEPKGNVEDERFGIAKPPEGGASADEAEKP